MVRTRSAGEDESWNIQCSESCYALSRPSWHWGKICLALFILQASRSHWCASATKTPILEVGLGGCGPQARLRAPPRRTWWARDIPDRKGVRVAGIFHAQCRMQTEPLGDYRTRLERSVRYDHEFSGCICQLPAPQTRRRMRQASDPHHSGSRLRTKSPLKCEVGSLAGCTTGFTTMNPPVLGARRNDAVRLIARIFSDIQLL